MMDNVRKLLMFKLLFYDIHRMWAKYDKNSLYFFVFSAKWEAVLHTAHSEETLGAEEKARDIVCAPPLLYGQHNCCSPNHCDSK